MTPPSVASSRRDDRPTTPAKAPAPLTRKGPGHSPSHPALGTRHSRAAAFLGFLFSTNLFRQIRGSKSAFFLASFATWSLVLSLSSLQAAAPLIQSRVTPAQDGWVGQALTYQLDVLFPGEMLRPPKVRPPNGDGLQVVTISSQGINLNESIDGKAYTGQRFEWQIYARRPGTLTLGPAAVEWSDRDDNPLGSAKSPSTTFTVQSPPGMDPSQPIIVTSSFSATQTWDPPAKTDWQAGDTLKRTITLKVDGISSMSLPPIDWTTPAAKTYPSPPLTEDRSNRGDISGIRTEEVTYLLNKDGELALPEIRFQWWDPRAKEVRHQSLPGLTLNVAPNPAATSAASPSKHLHPIWIVTSLAIITALWLLLHRHLASFTTLFHEWQERRRLSERGRFLHLIETARSGDPATTYESYRNWSLTRTDSPRARSRDLDQLLTDLETSLFGPPPRTTWTRGPALATALEKARSLRPAARQSPDPLPPLNPSSSAS